MSLVWCRCAPAPSGVKGVNVNLLKKMVKPASLCFVRHGHPAFTDEEFVLRKKAMSKWRKENWDWLTKKLKTTIPTLDLGVITTKTDGLPEYSEEPEYPPVFDASREGMKIYHRDQWIQKLREYPTVEEKMYWMNERRYYGFKHFLFTPDHEPYGAMDFLKHVTRTQLQYGLPDYLVDERLENVVKQHFPRVKDTLLDRLRFYKATQALSESIDPQEEKARQNKEVIQVIVDALVQEMSTLPECDHLRAAAVDLTPRVEASWFCGGFNPHRLLRLSRAGNTDDEEKINAKVSYPFQILCDIAAQVRTENPLPPVVEFSSPLVEHTEEKKVDWPFYPRSFQLPLEHRFGTSIPGYWPSDPNEFGQVAFAPRTFIDESSKYCFNGLYDEQEAVDQRGIRTGFAWTFAQATYQGFECYNDLTYPLVSQVVITDGQKFGFYVYQLNTTKIHDEFATDNPKWNLCWAADEMKLYEEIDDAGNFVGVNDSVVELLIKFMAHEPQKRAIDMHPYLGAERFVHNMPEGDYKNYIAEQFKFLASNRPRHIPRPEIYAWEKIFKIDFNARPRDARKRWFQLKENPNPSFEEKLKKYVRRTKY